MSPARIAARIRVKGVGAAVSVFWVQKGSFNVDAGDDLRDERVVFAHAADLVQARFHAMG